MSKAIRMGSTFTRRSVDVMVDTGYFAGAGGMAFAGALAAERLLIAVFG